MSEDEIIKICQNLWFDVDYFGIYYYKEENKAELAEQAIQDLLDLYNKEKQKNKELEKYKKYYETEKVVWSRKDYISKDKIREKIEELDTEMLKEENSLELFYRKKYCKEILQELLEGDK